MKHEYEQDLNDWLIGTQAARDALVRYCQSPLPNDIGQRHIDVELAIQNRDDAGRLLAELNEFLSHELARETIRIKNDCPGYSADERKLLVRDSVRHVQMLADVLSVTSTTIKERIYANLNANRSRN